MFDILCTHVFCKLALAHKLNYDVPVVLLWWRLYSHHGSYQLRINLQTQANDSWMERPRSIRTPPCGDLHQLSTSVCSLDHHWSPTSWTVFEPVLPDAYREQSSSVWRRVEREHYSNTSNFTLMCAQPGMKFTSSTDIMTKDLIGTGRKP